MFELYLGKLNTTPHHSTTPFLVSSAVHAVVLSAVAVLTLAMAGQALPELPSMMAFVAELPAPPPPPPASRKPAAPEPPKVAPSPDAAPIAVPPRIGLEPAAALGGEDGVEGGVEGGVPGGVLAGIAGGLPTEAPPPPPPPPPRARTPVRVGGQLQPPALLRRVEPDYPWLAVDRNIQGVVILEATVDENGQVADVRVLRAPSTLLADASTRAVRQWQYSPLVLNGIRERFIVTVTLTFSLK
jgi:protein TonB